MSFILSALDKDKTKAELDKEIEESEEVIQPESGSCRTQEWKSKRKGKEKIRGYKQLDYCSSVELSLLVPVILSEIERIKQKQN